MSAQGVRAGRAFVEIGADARPFHKTLSAAQKAMADLGRTMTRIGAATAAAGTAILAPLALSVKHFAAAGSAALDMATRTGLSVEAVSELGYAAKQTGADIADVETAVKKMSKSIVGADEESKSAQEALARLGLEAKDLAGLSPEKQFEKIGRAINAVSDPTLKSAAAMAIFGKSGTALIPMLAEIDELRTRAKQLGIVMSTDAAKAADAFGDSLDDLHFVVGALQNAIGHALAPVLTKVTNTIAQAAAPVIRFVQNHRDLVIIAASLGVGLVAVGTAIGGIGVALTVAVPLLTAGVTALATMGPLVVAAVAGVTALGVAFSGGSTSLDNFGKGITAIANDLRAHLGDALTFIGDLLVSLTVTWNNLGIAAQLAGQKAILAALDAKQALTNLAVGGANKLADAAQIGKMLTLGGGFDPSMRLEKSETSELQKALIADIAELESKLNTEVDRFHPKVRGALDKLVEYIREAVDGDQTPPGILGLNEHGDMNKAAKAAATPIAAATPASLYSAFSSRGLLQSGGGVTPMVAEQKRTNEHLAALRRDAQTGRLVFTG